MPIPRVFVFNGSSTVTKVVKDIDDIKAKLNEAKEKLAGALTIARANNDLLSSVSRLEILNEQLEGAIDSFSNYSEAINK